MGVVEGDDFQPLLARFALKGQMPFRVDEEMAPPISGMDVEAGFGPEREPLPGFVPPDEDAACFFGRRLPGVGGNGLPSWRGETQHCGNVA